MTKIELADVLAHGCYPSSNLPCLVCSLVSLPSPFLPHSTFLFYVSFFILFIRLLVFILPFVAFHSFLCITFTLHSFLPQETT